MHDPEAENVMLEGIIFVMLLPSTEAALSRELADYLDGRYFAEKAILNVVHMLTATNVKLARRWARLRMLHVSQEDIDLEENYPFDETMLGDTRDTCAYPDIF